MFQPVSVIRKFDLEIVQLASWFLRERMLKYSTQFDHWPRSLNELYLLDAYLKSTAFFTVLSGNKNALFRLFQLKGKWDQFWHWQKIGQDYSRVIIYIPFIVLESHMIHVKFQGNLPSGPREKCLLSFCHNWNGGHLGHVPSIKQSNFLSSFVWLVRWHLNGIRLVISERNCFEMLIGDEREIFEQIHKTALPYRIHRSCS